MRILSCLLLLIVVGLSMIPCCAPIAKSNLSQIAKLATQCCEDKKCHNTEVPSESNENESNCTTCSPFFSCGSCSGFTSPTEILTLTHLKIEMNNVYTIFKLEIDSDFFEIKWQPPKIS